MAIIVFLLLLLLNIIPLIGAVAANIIGPVMAGGLMLGCRALARDEPLSIGYVFAGFQDKPGPLLVLGVLWVLAFVAILLVSGILIGAGMIGMFWGSEVPQTRDLGALALTALVVLGLSVPLYMAMWFAPALVMLNSYGPLEALKTSFSACLKNIMPFLVYGVVAFLLICVAIIPFGLGLLIVMPLLITSTYASYRDIFYA